TVIVISMIDVARQRGLAIDGAALERELGCEVLLCSGRTGEGIPLLREALGRARIPTATPPGDDAGLVAWAERLNLRAATARPGGSDAVDSVTDRLDRAFTHPVLGVLI